MPTPTGPAGPDRATATRVQDGGQKPAKPNSRGSRVHARRRPRRHWRYLLAVPALVVVLLGVSIVGAAASPGNMSFQAKWADWLRSHDAGWISKHVEELYYSLHAPSKGGRPKHLNRVPRTVSVSPVTSRTPKGAHAGTSPSSPAGRAKAAPRSTTTTTVPGIAAPKPVPLVVHPSLPGEGKWQPTGPLVDGVPGMYVAQFRADNVYTSEITSAVWMDPKLLRFRFVPGQIEPGGTWAHPPYVTNAELPYLVAAFNGGFRFQDAHGGAYLEGKVAVPLAQGAASLVLYKNGQVNVGAWGSQVGMSPNVASVLQNEVLLVNNGQIAPSATYTDNAIWGYTLGGGAVVPRSGVGVTANGALVYVAGPALTAKSLAESLQRAGAVRAMTLDINPEWVTFNFYSHTPGHPSEVTGSKLYPEMQRPATRYLPPVLEARDFFEVLLPGAPASG